MKKEGIAIGYLIILIGLLHYYFSSNDFRASLEDWVEYLERATIPSFLFLPPISILDFCGSLLCCVEYRRVVKGRKSWFEVLLACTLMQFGGTTAVALVLGQPPSWLVSKTALPALLLAWWLVFCSPRDVFWSVLQWVGPKGLFLVEIMRMVSSSHAISSWGLDKAFNNAFHLNSAAIRRSHFVCILCGTLAGCAGGLTCDILGFLRSEEPFAPNKTPSILRIDNWSASATLNRCFWCAVIYFCLISPGVLFDEPFTAASGHSILVMINVMYLLQKSHVPEIDFLQMLSSTVLRILHINLVMDFGGPVTAPDTANKSKTS